MIDLAPLDNFHSPTTNELLFDVAKLIATYPGMVAPKEGSGPLTLAFGMLLDGPRAHAAILTVLRAWVGDNGGSAVDEGYLPNKHGNDGTCRVRFDERIWLIRTVLAPALLTLLLPLIAKDDASNNPTPANWVDALPMWRDAAIRRGFNGARMVHGAKKMVGLIRGEWEIRIPMDPIGAIALVESSHPEELWEMVYADPMLKAAMVVASNERED